MQLPCPTCGRCPNCGQPVPVQPAPPSHPWIPWTPPGTQPYYVPYFTITRGLHNPGVGGGVALKFNT